MREAQIASVAGEKRIKKRAKGLPRLGKKPYPPGRKRELISARVLPATKMALERIGAENLGRAIDTLVGAVVSCSDDNYRVAQALLRYDIPVPRI